MYRKTVEYLAKALDGTVEVAHAFPADKYDFWPAPQSMTVGEQIGHLTTCLNYFITPVGEMLGDAPLANDATDDPIMQLERAVTRMTEVLTRVPDEAWSHPLVYPDGYEMTPMYMTLAAIEHDAHHRGQLIVSLRLLGIDPPKRWKDG